MADRTPLHRAMIAAGMTYVGAAEVARVEKALEAEGVALVPLDTVTVGQMIVAGLQEPIDEARRHNASSDNP